jgi:outer membrane receptor protein involved in Fe transport
MYKFSVTRFVVCRTVRLLAVCLLAGSAALAQSSGAMSGLVTDPTGAVLPGVSLTATNAATGIGFQTTSTDAGVFVFPFLPVGTYELSAERSGFGTVVRKGIVVTVGANLNLSLAMAVAGQKETVEVTGELPVVETTRSSVAATVAASSISELPVNGRNFMDFVQLTPGVTRDPRTGDISFAGQRGTLNSLQIDGADNNNTFFGQTTGRTGSGRAPYQFSEDAVQEFQVNSNSYTAELGRAGGAVVNVVTKSGTNTFHGTAFEFYRDRDMNANDFINKIFKRPRGAYHYHQFGGNLGGPIVKDKLFFFFDYDGQRNTQQNLVTFTLPTGFTLSADPATAALQTRAINYLTPLASSWDKTFNQNVYLSKIDWHLTPRNLLSGRWNRQTFTGLGLESSGNVSVEHTGASNVKTDTLTGQLTSTLTNTIVNVARFTYLRDDEPGQANGINPEAIIKQSGNTLLTIGRNNFSPRFTNIKRVQWGDTLSFVHGKHSFKAGGDFIIDHIANFFPGFFSGSYTYTSLADFGAALNGTLVPAANSGDLFGQSFAAPGTPGPTTHPNRFEFGGFLQDEWRFSPRLTLNLGVRYDLGNKVQPPVNNPALTAALAAAPAGSLPPTLAAEASALRTNQAHNDHTNFGPRVGFAWDPLGDHKMVVRGGYGIFYGRTPSITLSTAISTNGVSVQRFNFNAGTPAGVLFPNTYPNTVCGAPPADGTPPSCAPPAVGAAPVTIFVFQPNYHEPLVQQGSLGVEYQLSRTTSLNVSYLWVKGDRLTRTRDINLSAPTPTVIPFCTVAGATCPSAGGSITYLQFPVVGASRTPVRPLAAFDRIDQFESTARSIYNGLTVSLNQRFAHNFQGMLSYTWGHVIDTDPDATAVVPGNSGDDSKIVSNQFNPNTDRGNGQTDQRHRFVLSGIWYFGNYANHLSSPVARGAFGGWEGSFIFTAQSGQPYSALANTDLNGDGNSFNDRIPTSGRDQFTTPSRVTLDPRITRTVKLGERAQLKLIWEAFNSLNRANFVTARNTQYNVGTTTAACGGAVTRCLTIPTGTFAFGFPNFTADFGQVGPRVMQLAAKFTF